MRGPYLRLIPLALLLSFVGCGESSPREVPGEPPPVALDGAFVSIPWEAHAEQHPQLRQALSGAMDTSGGTFYLAIRKNELGQRWFLSTFWKQLFPGGVEMGAAVSLGTRVVTFQEQNGKLFILDADHRKKSSDLFDPTVLVDAYPIIRDFQPFNRLRGADQYLLIDPTAGLSRINAASDYFSRYIADSAFRFEEELAFAQRFRRIEDGVTYEKVFTGMADRTPYFNVDNPLEPNRFRVSGTLGMALRKYQEGAGFTSTERPARDFYFPAEPGLIPDSSELSAPVAKWNIHPGMKPIAWHITDSILKVQGQPRYQPYDLVGAVKRGVEGWNQAFGFKVFEVSVGDSDLGFADDDKNVILFDTSTVNAFAFADWRTNPNTGEIRGATIYMNAVWVELGEAVFGSDGELHRPSPLPAGDRVGVAWSGMAHQPLCTLESDQALAHALAPDSTSHVLGLSLKEKVERYVTWVVLHEVGHTLGLQHNFAGSLRFDETPGAPVSNSVMDYLLEHDAIQLTAPGTYDIQAVRYLYGLSPSLPTERFCTYQDLGEDPDCNSFDRTSEPLTRFYLPRYQHLRDRVLAGTPFAVVSYSFNEFLNRTLQFVLAPRLTTQAATYALVMERLRPPLQIPEGVDPVAHGARADDLARRILSRLYLDARRMRGNFRGQPPNHAELNQAILADVRGILLNVDGVRGYASRRAMVEILKVHQSAAAYLILREARTQLTAQLPSLSGAALVEAEDLLARIHAASSPYYL
ncbi:zinc-dependent metalloprotease [Myxococcus stipitatus]|uniref:zinc-dependent metalloprotease n=1 Tax=Myxococcus stipitatus TaxID=83455 RepID=UPI003144F111